MSNRFDRTWSLEPFLHYHLDSALFFSKRAAELEREFYWGSPAREILTDEKMLTKNQRISTRWDKQLLTKEEQILEVTLLKEHLAYVIGSIFASVAFLEATINEVFLEANRGADESVRDGLLERLPAMLSTLWDSFGAINLKDGPFLISTDEHLISLLILCSLSHLISIVVCGERWNY